MCKDRLVKSGPLYKVLCQLCVALCVSLVTSTNVCLADVFPVFKPCIILHHNILSSTWYMVSFGYRYVRKDAFVYDFLKWHHLHTAGIRLAELEKVQMLRDACSMTCIMRDVSIHVRTSCVSQDDEMKVATRKMFQLSCSLRIMKARDDINSGHADHMAEHTHARTKP